MAVMWPLIGLGALFALAAASKKNGSVGAEPLEELEPVEPVTPSPPPAPGQPVIVVNPPSTGGFPPVLPSPGVTDIPPGFSTQPVTVPRPQAPAAPPVDQRPGIQEPVVSTKPEFGDVSPGQPIPGQTPGGKVPKGLGDVIGRGTEVADDLGDVVEEVTGIPIPNVDDVIGGLPPGIGEVIQVPPIITEPPNVADEPIFTTQPPVQRSPEILEPVEPVVPPPTLVEEVVEVDPREALAQEAYAMLLEGAPVQDKALLRSYQRQEGLDTSGVYGPGTGKSFIKYGLIPPKPFTWPTSNVQSHKDNWRGNMLTMARKDPQRAEEWREASKV